MIRNQIWKKRSAGLSGELRGDATTSWLSPNERDREWIMTISAGKQRKAGVKPRKY
jgi:hypothetical protein